MLKQYYKRLISITIVALVTIVILLYAINTKNNTTRQITSALQNDDTEQSSENITVEFPSIIPYMDNSNKTNDTHLMQDLTNEYFSDSTSISENNIYKTEEGEPEEEHNLIEYIIDIVSIDNNTLYGDTATISDYSGRIGIDISHIKYDDKQDIKVGDTIVVKAKSLISMQNIPIIDAVSIKKASEEQINKLDYFRSNISNYNECMLNYSSMNISNIVEDANQQYVYWTQEQRKDFIEYINSLNYNEVTDGAIKIVIYDNNLLTNKDNVIE